MADNKVKFLRGTSDEYAVAGKDSDTIYFTTDENYISVIRKYRAMEVLLLTILFPIRPKILYRIRLLNRQLIIKLIVAIHILRRILQIFLQVCLQMAVKLIMQLMQNMLTMQIMQSRLIMPQMRAMQILPLPLLMP